MDDYDARTVSQNQKKKSMKIFCLTAAIPKRAWQLLQNAPVRPLYRGNPCPTQVNFFRKKIERTATCFSRTKINTATTTQQNNSTGDKLTVKTKAVVYEKKPSSDNKTQEQA